jgi:hypothetical protein
MFAFTSKYALALYEMGEKRRNMQFRWSEVFEIGELRELLGVKPRELTTFGNLNAWCLKPAAREVNGLRLRRRLPPGADGAEGDRRGAELVAQERGRAAGRLRRGPPGSAAPSKRSCWPSWLALEPTGPGRSDCVAAAQQAARLTQHESARKLRTW